MMGCSDDDGDLEDTDCHSHPSDRYEVPLNPLLTSSQAASLIDNCGVVISLELVGRFKIKITDNYDVVISLELVTGK